MNLNNNLTQSYTPQSSFDEFLGQDSIRPHWHTFIQQFNKLTSEEIEQAVQNIRRNLRDNGVTYNLHTQNTQQKRAWLLDILPNIISEADWIEIEAALKQRSQLLKLILEDCYGDQRLIKEGLIPAEVIFAHRGYLLPAFGLKPNLSLIATDIARGVNGELWVVSDRTQVPSGMGYALENRTVLRSVVPQFFQTEKVSSLSNFFRNMQTNLSNLSARQITDQNIVLLSPGSNTETYFEHAYLASYLGYTLVQGGDLSVREGKVFLKTLDGLEAVDIIIRRVDDDYTDPLELRSDSHIGIPGLLETIRRGNVAVANSIGSSLLENPGLLPFLPNLAKDLLGEDLKIASVATWWCGHPKECQHVLNELGNLIIKRIDRKQKSQTIFANTLSYDKLEVLRKQIESEPHLYVGQEILEHATTPVLTSQQGSTRLEPRHSLLRCFITNNNDSFEVMPGGLSRTSTEQGNTIISNRMGGVSKDTWVLKNKIEPHKSLWYTSTATNQAANKVFKPSVLPSRTADNLFWVGRYAERSEAIARFLRIIVQLLIDKEQDPIEEKVRAKLVVALLHLIKNEQNLSQKAVKKGFDIQSEVVELNFNPQNIGGLYNTLNSMLNAANEIKSSWSTDSWRILVSLQDIWQTATVQTSEQKDVNIANLIDPLNNYITGLMAFSGLNAESMNHSIGWRFLDMGRRVERAKVIALLVKVSFTEELETDYTNRLLDKILTLSENIISYRRNYRSNLNLNFALELLLFDEHNPRALAFQLRRLEEHLQTLPQSNRSYPLGETEKVILQARTNLRLADFSELSKTKTVGNSTVRLNLQTFLDEQMSLLDRYTNVLNKRYFNHTMPSHQLSETIGQD